MIGSLLFLALASAPAILLPPWPLSPDGDLVAYPGPGPLHAEGADVEPVAPGLYRVVPADGIREVRLQAGEAAIVASVEPPPAEIGIAFAPAAPVKGRQREVALEITVPRPAGDEAEPGPPEVVASVGRVRGMARAGPGRFRAVYELPSTRNPEVAVLLALSPRCPTCTTPRSIGHAIVPISGAVDLPGTAEPGVKTTLVIGGRSFGPAVADRLGRFTVSVVVPPGVRAGVADSIDSLGNRQRKEIDLQIPPANRLACAAWPRTIPADGRSAAAIWCVASGVAGEPEPAAKLVLAAGAGAVSAAAPFRGALQRAIFRAPRGGGGTDAVVSATYPDGGPASRDQVRVTLVTGPPAEIAAEVLGQPVPLGAAVPAMTEALDANGDTLGPPRGDPGAVEGFVASDRFVAQSEPGDYVQRARLSFSLAPGSEIATLSLRRDRGQWIASARTVDARPAAGAAVRFGSGASATTDARGEAREPAQGDRETVAAANGARAAGFDDLALPPPPLEVSRVVSVALRAPAPVDVSARVEDGWLLWKISDAKGTPLPGRSVALKARSVVLGPPQPHGEGGRAEVRGGHGPVAVVDALTGIAAIVEVP